MNKDEAMQAILGTSEDDLGDVLIDLACQYWTTNGGATPNEVLALVATVLEEG